jgi:hypothetical protein
MNDELAKQLIAEIKQIAHIAIPSINPDPAQTIQAYRDQRAAQQRAADQLVTATEALVSVTRRLAVATWVLVVLTVVMAGAQIVGLWRGGGS